MADCRLSEQQMTLQDVSQATGIYQPGVSVHGCVKALNVASPATKLFYSGREERTYAFLYSDDDEEWRDEVLIRVSDLADAETQTEQQQALNSETETTQTLHKLPTTPLASESRLGPVRHSDIGLATAISQPTFTGEEGTEATDTQVDSTVRFATDAKTDDAQGPRKIQGSTPQRATRSEGLVKAGERPHGRGGGRILEIGRSIANVLTRPFRHQRGRRREKKPTTDKSEQPENNTVTPPKLEDTTKMEESRLPAEIISKQFPSKRPTKHTTYDRVTPKTTTAQTN